jgi:hypothetical protein
VLGSAVAGVHMAVAKRALCGGWAWAHMAQRRGRARGAREPIGVHGADLECLREG